jgi:hypothetical protein
MNKMQLRIKRVLERIMDNVEQDKDFARYMVDELENTLDGWHMDDGFGTEGQNDPRGDFRNGKWTMKRVEGVDT